MEAVVPSLGEPCMAQGAPITRHAACGNDKVAALLGYLAARWYPRGAQNMIFPLTASQCPALLPQSHD